MDVFIIWMMYEQNQKKMELSEWVWWENSNIL